MASDGIVHAGDAPEDHVTICNTCQQPCSGDFRSLDGKYYHPEHRPASMKP